MIELIVNRWWTTIKDLRMLYFDAAPLIRWDEVTPRSVMYVTTTAADGTVYKAQMSNVTGNAYSLRHTFLRFAIAEGEKVADLAEIKLVMVIDPTPTLLSLLFTDRDEGQQ